MLLIMYFTTCCLISLLWLAGDDVHLFTLLPVNSAAVASVRVDGFIAGNLLHKALDKLPEEKRRLEELGVSKWSKFVLHASSVPICTVVCRVHAEYDGKGAMLNFGLYEDLSATTFGLFSNRMPCLWANGNNIAGDSVVLNGVSIGILLCRPCIVQRKGGKVRLLYCMKL